MRFEDGYQGIYGLGGICTLEGHKGTKGLHLVDLSTANYRKDFSFRRPSMMREGIEMADRYVQWPLPGWAVLDSHVI